MDTEAPAKPGLPNLIDAHDTGAYNNDNITNMATVTIDGTAEANALIHIYKGGAYLTATNANASGAWSSSIGLTANAWNSITVYARDAAGNWSVVSDTLSVYSDRTAPSIGVTYNTGTNECKWQNNIKITLSTNEARKWIMGIPSRLGRRWNNIRMDRCNLHTRKWTSIT